MEKIIKFIPGYDKRSDDPKQNFGIHGVNLLFVLKGEEGAVTFTIYTNWMPKSCRVALLPMPADLGYHSKVPSYEGQCHFEKCDWLNGECYYDGSTLNAEPIFELLVDKGEEAVWEALEQYYKDVFLSK